MISLRSAVLCLFFLPFFSCEKPQEQSKQPEVHQISFGVIDGNPNGNRVNKGFRFSRFMQIDLNSDSILLKVNQTSLEEYEDGKRPAKYFTDKTPAGLKDDLTKFKNSVLQKKSGPNYKIRS